VAAAATTVQPANPADIRYALTDASENNSYPVSDTVWAVLRGHQPADKGEQLIDLLWRVTHDGQRFATGP
jgi:hypothetical protein